jgi:hypothetical protein
MNIPSRLMPTRLRVAQTEADDLKVSSASTQMAVVMAVLGKPFYEGTVSPAVVAQRRTKNKAARVARRAGRR